jgi:hypothetical protein
MGTRHQRTARRFQVEALEGRLAPSGPSGCGGDISKARVLYHGAAHIGEEIPQVQVAHPVAYGSKPGVASGAN